MRTGARGFTFETALALPSTLSGLGGVVGGIVLGARGGLRWNRVFGVLISMAVASVLVALWAGFGLVNPDLRRVEDRGWLEREAAGRSGAGRSRAF